MKILVSTDGSPLSEKAIASAVGLAKSLGAKVVGVTVAAASGPASAEGEAQYTERELADVNEKLGAVEAEAKRLGVEYELYAKSTLPVWRAILDCAAEQECRMIVMASRGRGSIGSLLLGSETQKVLASADRPVLVVR